MQSIKLINGKEHQQEAEGCLVDTGVGTAHIISIVYDVQSIDTKLMKNNEWTNQTPCSDNLDTTFPGHDV